MKAGSSLGWIFLTLSAKFSKVEKVSQNSSDNQSNALNHMYLSKLVFTLLPRFKIYVSAKSWQGQQPINFSKNGGQQYKSDPRPQI